MELEYQLLLIFGIVCLVTIVFLQLAQQVPGLRVFT